LPITLQKTFFRLRKSFGLTKIFLKVLDYVLEFLGLMG